MKLRDTFLLCTVARWRGVRMGREAELSRGSLVAVTAVDGAWVPEIKSCL